MAIPSAMKVYEGIPLGICMAGWLVDIQHSPQSGGTVELQGGAKIHEPPTSQSLHICSRQNTVNLDTQSSSSPGVLTLVHKKITQEMDS